MAKAPFIAGGIFGACALIVIIILISVSFSKVEMTEVGLLYSHASRKIDRSKLYTAGRYYVGVGGEFITFPITQQEMHLPIFESRTADGLLLSLDVSLNFKIQKDFDKIIKIFDNFGRHYDGFISRLAMNIIRDASARFTAYSYSMNRSLVNVEMERDINDDLAEIGFTLDSVQLLNVEFPSNFSDTLQETRMLQQKVTQAELNLNAEVRALQGQLDNCNTTAKGMITQANTDAKTLNEEAEAKAESLRNSLAYEGISHKAMIDLFAELSIAGDEEAKLKEGREKFVSWYYMDQLSNSKSGKSIAASAPALDNN